MKKATPIHDLDFQSFEGFSCYYSPLPLPMASPPSAALTWPEETHEQVEILVLFENALAQPVWPSAHGAQQKTIAAGKICIIPHHQCGFYDQSHFILQFRRFTGIILKSYREQAIPDEKRAG